MDFETEEVKDGDTLYLKLYEKQEKLAKPPYVWGEPQAEENIWVGDQRLVNRVKFKNSDSYFAVKKLAP